MHMYVYKFYNIDKNKNNDSTVYSVSRIDDISDVNIELMIMSI